MGKKGLKVILLALISLFLLAVVISMASGAEASNEPEFIGSEPPFIGPWYIEETTIVKDGELNLSMDVYVTKGVEMLISNVTFNVVRDYPHQYTFTVMAGATFIGSACELNMDIFKAESQASLNFEAGTIVKTTGRFIGACNNFFAEDTTFINRAPAVDEDQRGEDAVFIADGRVNSEFLRITIKNKGSNAGLTTPGFDGKSGGRAMLISNITTWIDCDVENIAGLSRGGGLGLAGASGGDGGLGGDVEVRLFSSYMENVKFIITASNGGAGAGGSRNTAGNGGHGGDGAEGGIALVTLKSPSILEMYNITISIKSGNGGSGGNGGEAIDGDGGTAGYGANAGTCIIEISCIDDIIIEDSTFTALGGEGGYGGDYGRNEGGTGSFGIPRPGGNGGDVLVEILGQVNMYLEDLKIEARGGHGLDGGGGYEQGDTGGNGAEGTIKIHAEANIKTIGADLTVIGGNGGPGGPAFSEIRGNGGDGGNAWVEFTGLLEMEMDAFFIYVIVGTGGLGRDPLYAGADGIETLDLETELLHANEGTFNMPLDDLSGNARGYLYNVEFDMEFGIHVLPIGDAIVWEMFSVTVLVEDDPDPAKATPLEGYMVSVFHILTGALVSEGTTDDHGLAYFDLTAFEYTSLQVFYLGSYHFIASTPDRKTTKKVQGEIQGKDQIRIAIQENVKAPVIIIEEPEDDKNYPFDKVEKRMMEAYGFVTDDDGSPIIAMFVQLHPEKDDAFAWPEFKLGLSPVPLEDLSDQDLKWGKYFPPDEHTNRWRFFYRFEIIGGDVLYESDSYIFRVTANDGVHITEESISIDVQIEPEQEPPKMRVYASVNPGVQALDLVEFNGTVTNVEELHFNGVEVAFYAWDFESDGVLDYYSTENAATWHIYEDEGSTVKIKATLKIEDSLGRSINISRDISVAPPPPPTKRNPVLDYLPYIILTFLVVLVAVGVMSVRSRKTQAAAANEERRRIEEAMANIHECPRCGDLLDTSFATCGRCKVEDDLLEAQELIQELKDQGIIVLEQEELLDKSLVSFEGRDFDTAKLFITQAIEQANHNTLRFHQTTEELEHVEKLIKSLKERNVDLPEVEIRVYHSKLALGRSDFDGAKEIADEILSEISKLDAESRKDQILKDIQKVEKEVRTAKALDEVDSVPANRALVAAKAAYGIKDYVEAEVQRRNARKLLEDPTWTPDKEREEEERRKEEEVKMAISAAETAEILEIERLRQEELAAISTAETGEVKIMSFEEEEEAALREVKLDTGDIVDHEVSREEVVDHEAEPTPSIVPVEEIVQELELEPEPEPEPEAAPVPVAKAAPKPVAKPTPAPRPVAKPKPARAPKPVTKPAPKPVETEAEADGKVNCSKCGKDIKSAWKKCPFCGEEQ